MIKYLFTILLSLVIGIAWAQSETNTSAQEVTIADQRLQDTAQWQLKWDSLQSLTQTPNQWLQSFDTLSPKLSLDSANFLNKWQGNADSLRQLPGQYLNTNYWKQQSKLWQKADSLSRTPQHLIQKIDSLVQVKAELLQEKIAKLQGKVKGQGVADKVEGLGLDQLEGKAQEKIGAGLSKLDPGLYQDKMQKVNGLLDDYTGKLTDIDELQWVQHYTSQLDQLEGKLSGLGDNLLNSDKLSFLQGYQEQLQKIGQESSGYFKISQDLLAGGLSEDSPLIQSLEQKVGHFKEFQELQKQTAELEKLKQMPDEYKQQYEKYQDKDYLKEQALAKAKELGTKHFAEHQDKLQAAQQTLTKYKKKYSAIQSTKDMSTAVKRSSLKGKPLGERLVLGGTFQIHKDPLALDVAPLVGYKLNKNYELGIGATYRADLDFKHKTIQNQVYGFRGYFERMAFNGFFAHAEFETMNRELLDPTTEEAKREYVHGVLLGIGKEYTFIKGIKGNVMLLYNLLHDPATSPYDKPLVIRFGFKM